MAHRQVLVLQIWRSRTLAGWQWAAQVQHLADGQEQRFTDPDLFLSYLRSVTCAVEHMTAPTATAPVAYLPGDGALVDGDPAQARSATEGE